MKKVQVCLKVTFGEYQYVLGISQSSCCIVICRFMRNTTTQWRRVTQSFRKYTSHFIWKGKKGLLKVLLWDGVGDRNRTTTYWPPLLWPSAVCLSRPPNAQPEARGPSFLLSAGFLYHVLPLTHLISNSNWLPVSTELYNIVQSPTQYLLMTGHRDVSLPPSLEWHVWSSPSGNNCHAVHRSLSSCASVCKCTAGFYRVPYCQPDSPRPTEYALPPSWNGMFGRVEGQYTTQCGLTILRPLQKFWCILTK